MGRTNPEEAIMAGLQREHALSQQDLDEIMLRAKKYVRDYDDKTLEADFRRLVVQGLEGVRKQQEILDQRISLMRNRVEELERDAALFQAVEGLHS